MKKLILLVFSLVYTQSIMAANMTTKQIRVSTFNVSMEALNYVKREKNEAPVVSGKELINALESGNQQVKNIAEIIQKIRPDIILLNEFDRNDDSHAALKTFLNNYLAKSQKNEEAINYPYFYQGPVNTGVTAPFDFNNNNQIGETPADTYGFGYFPGHFAMAILSKYPIDESNIRTFQLFKWKDMPGALKPINPESNKPYYNKEAWQNFRLSSKSHWDIPIKVNETVVHILASHPTPPVFDGPEDRNGKRNHDEIRFWHDYIDKDKSQYIYDDKNNYGGLSSNSRFIILGDLNASPVEGDAINTGIMSLTKSEKIQDSKPQSLGGKEHSPDSPYGLNQTAYWRMRADYVLPSKYGFNVINSGVFWPEKADPDFRLIKDRQASSDHRLVWLDLEITK